MTDPTPPTAPQNQPPSPTPVALPPVAPPATPVPPAPEGVMLVSFDDFKRIKLVTAEIVAAVAHPKADKLLLVQIKIGDTTRQVVAGIRAYYAPEALVGRTVIVVENLQPAKLRGEMSNGMLLAVSLPEGGLRLLTTDGPAPSGLRVS